MGAVASNSRYQVLASGYNGSPRGFRHCIDPDAGCIINKQGSCVRTLHAEQNMICQASYEGVRLRDALVFTTHRPCEICAKMLIQVGVKKIYYNQEYDTGNTGDLVNEMCRIAQVDLYRWSKEEGVFRDGN